MRAVPDIWTDFSRHPHEELIRALSVSKPNEVVAAGDAWAAVAAALYERAQDIADRSGTLASGWTGSAADRYRQMMSELLGGVRRIAAAAMEARDLTYAAGEALQASWTAMPPVSGEAARRQAVLVMAQLAERYLAIAAELNETMSQLLPGVVDPAQGGPSRVPPPGEPVFGNPNGSGTGGGRQPLFGGMLPAGLAAAGAVLGRPFVPSLLMPRREPYPPKGAVPDDTAGAADKTDKSDSESAAADVSDSGEGGSGAGGSGAGGSGAGGGGAGGGGAGGGGAGGGGAGLSGLGGGGGLPPLPELGGLPQADPGIGGTGPEQAGGIAAATGGAAAAGTGGMRGMPMMPMMPMGAGGESGGGKRLPPWLVETEDVWGEPAVVTSSVIGEDGAGGAWW
ncbi:MAG: hypothetical protein ABW000_25875 [Actinoplanes sp.]